MEIDKLKCTWKHERQKTVKAVLRKDDKVGVLTISSTKTYNKENYTL